MKILSKAGVDVGSGVLVAVGVNELLCETNFQQIVRGPLKLRTLDARCV
jgi:hypothetical protein